MDTVINPQSIRIKIVFCIAFLLIFFVGYFDSLSILFRLWAGIEETIYRYGFLVLACTCYLLYLKRFEFKAFVTQTNYWALIPAAGLATAWAVAALAGVQTVQLAVLPLLLLSVMTASFGLGFLRLTGVPILLLLFAIPLWWPLLPLLKDGTTLATELFLRAIDKPVFVEGYFLHLPGGSFFVDDGCAGLRFLLVTLILGFMSVDMHALSLKQGAILLGFGVTMALVANWIRVIIVVLVGDYTKMEHRLVDDHNDLGWLVYSVLVLLPLFLLIGRFTAQELPATEVGKGTVDPANSKVKPFVISYVLAVGILVTGPLLLTLVRFQDYELREVSLPAIPAGWRDAGNIGSQWRANYIGADNYLYNRYRGEDGLVELHIVNYANQQEGVELINVDNTLTDGEQWKIVPDSEQQLEIDIESGDVVNVLTAEIESTQGEHKLIWYWFDIGSYPTTNTYMAKVFQLLVLVNGRKDANLVAVASDCGFNCAFAAERIERFVQEAYSSLKASL